MWVSHNICQVYIYRYEERGWILARVRHRVWAHENLDDDYSTAKDFPYAHQ